MDGAGIGGNANDDTSAASAEASLETEGIDRSQAVTLRLLDAAVAVFAESGFESARVAEIARRAGFTTGAIYARWEGKRALIVDAVDHISPEFMDLSAIAADTLAAETLAALGARLMDTRDAKYRDVMVEAYVSARRDQHFRTAISRCMELEAGHLQEIVARGKLEGSIDPDLGTGAIVAFFRALRLGMHLDAAASDSRVARADWVDLVDRLVEALGPAASTRRTRTDG